MARADEPGSVDLARFAASLRTAWAEGERRPTHRRRYVRVKPVVRTSMLDAVRDQMLAWLEAQPALSAVDALERLRELHPDRFRADHLRTAVRSLGDAVLAVSGVYETPPWGDADQPSYLNAVVLVSDPEAAPYDWLDRARAAETAAERVRDPERRFGPRTLDVDVIAVWDADDQPVISDDPELTLPHPRAHLRAFVLRPWHDIEPGAELPGPGPIAALLAAPELADDVAGLTPRPDLALELKA